MFEFDTNNCVRTCLRVVLQNTLSQIWLSAELLASSKRSVSTFKKGSTIKRYCCPREILSMRTVTPFVVSVNSCISSQSYWSGVYVNPLLV